MSHASDPDVRARGIGSSDVAAVLGLNKWESAHDLWMEKRGMAAPVEDNPYLRRGRLMEPLLRDEYETLCGYDPEDVISGGYIDAREDHPWFHGHPDLIVAIDGQKQFPVELKTAERGTYHRAVNEGLPLHYLCQLVHEMYLCEADHAELFMLNPDSWQSHIFKIDRDETTDKLWSDIVQACNEFWRHVVDGTPPEALPQPDNLPIPTGGKVQQVMDEIWLKAGVDLAVAQEIESQAKELTKQAKARIEKVMDANGWLIAEGPIAMPEGTRTLRYHYREVKGRTTIKGKDLLAVVQRWKSTVETFGKLPAGDPDAVDAFENLYEEMVAINLSLFKKTGDPSMKGSPFWIVKRAEIDSGPQVSGLIE